eukprot:CAMPEP_0194076428 /NCGR_PEP_ID=MMETSP0149-20130528/3233_1 /TAXON_ID=122233 /ORGANISM="Chaetoceros debilis, Strain MM31A-1" /LENGTH=50 /DNA_ID=CAMNT_0038757169 /DNA_START=64 /DNA_END=213 /DNA_ORIENTATION=+
MISFKTTQARDTIAALTARENRYEEKFCRPRPFHTTTKDIDIEDFSDAEE